MGIEILVGDSQIVVTLDNQFGDRGKGKIADWLAAYWADVNARGTGGSNAGHCVEADGKRHAFNLIPAGILQDKYGKPTMLGNGMVILLSDICRELDSLDSGGLTYNHLMISKDAHVVMPYHTEFDGAKNKSQKGGGVGSTGKGIGPCYTDKIARWGIRIEDLFDRDRLAKKIAKAAQFYPNQKVNVDEIIDKMTPQIERIKPFVRDTVTEMHNFVRQGKKIAIEGAQGLMLSVEHGTYPYLTSSDCSLNGTASGVGLSAKAVDLAFGAVGFPFYARVGGGPLVSELGGRDSETYCGDEPTLLDEVRKYGIPHTVVVVNGKEKVEHYDRSSQKIIDMMNSDDEFVQGVGIRLAANEFGTTTGRTRRTAWTDAVIGRYAVGINGPLMILTKADCLAGIKQFKLCTSYSHEGGETSTRFSKDERFLRNAKPVYETFEGYGDISDVRDFDRLPSSLKSAIARYEQITEGRVVAVSVGADRDATIVR